MAVPVVRTSPPHEEEPNLFGVVAPSAGVIASVGGVGVPPARIVANVGGVDMPPAGVVASVGGVGISPSKYIEETEKCSTNKNKGKQVVNSLSNSCRPGR